VSPTDADAPVMTPLQAELEQHVRRGHRSSLIASLRWAILAIWSRSIAVTALLASTKCARQRRGFPNARLCRWTPRRGWTPRGMWVL